MNEALNRRARERPLKALSDDELLTLDQLQRFARLLRPGLAEPLGDLSELASLELSERQYEHEIRQLQR
jgi:hypothetical protein